MRFSRDAGRLLFVVPVLAMAVGLAGAGAIWAREVSQARQRDMRTASQVATAVARTAGVDVDGLRGASALVADDEQVSPAELASYGRELFGGSAIRVLAVAYQVDDAGRAALEARIGHEITDAAPGGREVRAEQRSTYVPVVAAVAADPSITPRIGIDLLSDPTRAAAIAHAAAQPAPTISAPLTIVPTGRVGYLTVTALRTPAGKVVGYLTAVFAIEDVLDQALANTDGRSQAAIFDHGVRIAGTLDGGASAAVVIGGRPFVIRADEPTGANPWSALALAVGAVLVGVALAVSISRLRRSERSASALAANLARDRTGAMRLAELGGPLTSARTRADVVDLVGRHAADVANADHAALSFVEGALLRTATSRGTGPPDDAHELVPLDTHLPRTEAVRSGVVVTLEDISSYQREHPDLLASARARGVASVAAIPLVDASGAVFGVLDLVWRDRQTFPEPDQVRLRTLGALVAGTLQRVDVAELEARRAEHLAAFAQRLAVAATAADVHAVVDRDGAELLAAAHTDCVVVAADGGLEQRGGDPPIDAAAMASAVERALGGDDVAAVTDDAGRVVFVALALRVGQDVRGVMRVSWGTPIVVDPRLRTTLRTVADLTGQALVRARSTDATVRHADGLAGLAEQLARATSLEQVSAAASDYLPAIIDAADVHLAVDGEPGGDGERHPLTDTSGEMVGELVVTWPAATAPDAAQQERLRAAIRLIDDTVRRVDIQRSTSQTLLSLRQRLLRPLPSPHGLELAARYRPTSRPLGMGGDWYDVIERPNGTVAIVIGDVVGHGIPAIATMIHVSTILGGLVRSGTAEIELMGRASAMLDGDGMVATAQVLVIDPGASSLTMVSAGHPPPLLRSPDGTVDQLPVAAQPPLGVGDGTGPVVHVEFPVGAVVLGYTDGLVERRGESIDTGISRLADVLASTNGSVRGTIAAVLSAMGREESDRGDDDIAIVVAEHRASR